MNNLAHKLKNRALRKNRIRSTVVGTPERPRLSVYISNANITAQIIDDSQHKTLAYATTVGKKNLKGTMTEKAATVGEEIAKAAKTAKVSKVAFDRNGRI